MPFSILVHKNETLERPFICKASIADAVVAVAVAVVVSAVVKRVKKCEG